MQLDEDLKAQLSKEQDFVKAEVDELRSRVIELKEELESIWSTETNACYELTSVFVHRGASPSWGHYFFYSRNLPDQPDTWFKYNDSDVTEVSKDEVLADTTGSTANPYLVRLLATNVITVAKAFQSLFLHVKGQKLFKQLNASTQTILSKRMHNISSANLFNRLGTHCILDRIVSVPSSCILLLLLCLVHYAYCCSPTKWVLEQQRSSCWSRRRRYYGKRLESKMPKSIVIII